jgi:hypothetical protein
LQRESRLMSVSPAGLEWADFHRHFRRLRKCGVTAWGIRDMGEAILAHRRPAGAPARGVPCAIEDQDRGGRMPAVERLRLLRPIGGAGSSLPATSRQSEKGAAHDHQAWQASAHDGTGDLAKSGYEDRRRRKPKPKCGSNQSQAPASGPGIARRHGLILAQSLHKPTALVSAEQLAPPNGRIGFASMLDSFSSAACSLIVSA